jgi:hypothetical protein
MILRSVHNQTGNAIANTLRLRPGQTILLAYGGDSRVYRALARCRIAKPAKPINTGSRLFPGCSYANDANRERIRAAGYEPDPVLGRFTGIPVGDVEDLRRDSFYIPRPIGNNAIWSWRKVFTRR